MARPRKNTKDIGSLMKILKHFFGTPKTTYRVLCLEEVGMTWSEFQYAWTHERTSEQVSGALQECWLGLFYEMKTLDQPEDILTIHPGEFQIQQARYCYEKETDDE